MKKGLKIWGGMVVLGCTLAVSAFAEQAGAAVAGTVSSSGFFEKAVIVTGAALAVAATFAAISQGWAVGKALDGIARQPEASDKIQLAMIIGLAFIESLVLYVLFIGIILLFANPFIKYLVK